MIVGRTMALLLARLSSDMRDMLACSVLSLANDFMLYIVFWFVSAGWLVYKYCGPFTFLLIARTRSRACFKL